MTSYILEEKGEEVISERHQSDYVKEEDKEPVLETKSAKAFTDVSFDDI